MKSRGFGLISTWLLVSFWASGVAAQPATEENKTTAEEPEHSGKPAEPAEKPIKPGQAPRKPQRRPDAAARAPSGVPASTAVASDLDFKASDADLSLVDLLENKVTTATKTARSLEEVPSIVTTFTRAEIDALGAERLIDLLRLTPGFVEVSSVMQRNVGTRGVHASTAETMVVLIDGLRMNDYLANAADPDGFLLSIAKRVEIIRGPGAALYGSNALTGVVNIITRDPMDEPRFSVAAGGSYPRGLGAELTYADATDKSSQLISLRVTQFDGTPVRVGADEDVLLPSLGANSSNGIQRGENLTLPRAGTNVYVNRYGPSAEGLVKYQVGGATVRLSFGRKDFRPQRTSVGGLIHLDDESQVPQRVDQRLSADVRIDRGQADKWGQISFRPAFWIFSHEQDSQLISNDFFAAAARQQRASILRWSGQDIRVAQYVEYHRKFSDLRAGSVALLRNTEFLAGAAVEYSVASNYRTTRCAPDPDDRFPAGPYAQDASSPDYGCVEGGATVSEAFTIDRWGNRVIQKKPRAGDADDIVVGAFGQLSTTLPADLQLTLGGRVDYNPEFDPELTPRLAISRAFGEYFYSKLLYSSAFMYPTLLSRYGNRQANFVGNPTIRPQRIQMAEALIGVHRRNTWRVEVNGYHTVVTDFITLDEQRLAATQELVFDNRGRMELLGGEVGASLNLFDGYLTAFAGGGVTYPLPSTDERFVYDGQLGGPSKYPTHSGTLRVGGRPLQPLWIGLAGVFASAIHSRPVPAQEFQNITGTDGRAYDSKALADYPTWRAQIDATASFAITKQWLVAGKVANVLDTAGRMAGASFVPYAAEGRSLHLSLRYTLE